MHTLSTPEDPYSFYWPPPPAQSARFMSPGIRDYRPGERYDVSWLAGPIAPGLDRRNPLRRAGPVMQLAMAGLVDAHGNYASLGTSGLEDGFTTELKVYEDDALLVETRGFTATLEVADRPADYRIEYDVDNHTAWGRLSTDTRAVWTFRSAPEGDAIVTPPLVTVAWDAPLDLENRLQHRGEHRLGITVGHQPGAPAIPIGELDLDVSYDDGATGRRGGRGTCAATAAAAGSRGCGRHAAAASCRSAYAPATSPATPFANGSFAPTHYDGDPSNDKPRRRRGLRNSPKRAFC